MLISPYVPLWLLYGLLDFFIFFSCELMVSNNPMWHKNTNQQTFKNKQNALFLTFQYVIWPREAKTCIHSILMMVFYIYHTSTPCQIRWSFLDKREGEGGVLTVLFGESSRITFWWCIQFKDCFCVYSSSCVDKGGKPEHTHTHKKKKLK